MVIDIDKDKGKKHLYTSVCNSNNVYITNNFMKDYVFCFMNTSIFRLYLLDNDYILQLHRRKLENTMKVNAEIEKSTEMAICLYLMIFNFKNDH
jgi:hypothetical protein